MLYRNVFIVTVLAVLGCESAALANSCSNVTIMGTFDGSGIQENQFGIYTAGTFRIASEADENKQPMFNLTMVKCERPSDGTNDFECNVTRASVSADSDPPTSDSSNCFLDLDTTRYTMKELQKGVLLGMEPIGSTSCFDSTLTIDRNTKRVYLSYTRTHYADNYDKIQSGTCGDLPRTQVLMNCTVWPKLRSKDRTPPRYCDFSSVSDR